MSRDLMHSSEIKDLVRAAYATVGTTDGAVACNLYDRAQLELLPRTAYDQALGVGNHLRHADIVTGDTVVDLGCGAGVDCVLAAHRTGPTGRVIGLDFLDEMLDKTERSAEEAGLASIETLYGEMEAIPLPDDSVDVVISNGVINLSARKSRVMFECARVLRPGGSFCVSDLTLSESELPPEILTHPSAWAG
jgi:ubiquinone/menaquinone biosynthesis C-methylase UbiE